MSDENRFSFTARLGVEPKMINEGGDRPFGKLFALLNESYEKNGKKVENTMPLNIVVLKPEAIDLVREKLHTGDAISGQGKLTRRSFEKNGVEQSVYEVVIAGPKSKLEILDRKPKKKATEPAA